MLFASNSSMWRSWRHSCWRVDACTAGSEWLCTSGGGYWLLSCLDSTVLQTTQPHPLDTLKCVLPLPGTCINSSTKMFMQPLSHESGRRLHARAWTCLFPLLFLVVAFGSRPTCSHPHDDPLSRMRCLAISGHATTTSNKNPQLSIVL